MTAVLESRSNAVSPPPANGQRLVVPGDWRTYRQFLDLRDERCLNLRINFDRGRIEIMTLSSLHERLKFLFGRILDIVFEELRIPSRGMGQATVSSARVDGGCEPDVWYYLFDRAIAPHDRNESIDFDRQPPDLCVEIEITRSLVGRLPILAAMGVREVWRFDGQQLQFLHLADDGTYREQPLSFFLPALEPSQILRVIDDSDEKSDLDLFSEFRERLRNITSMQ